MSETSVVSNALERGVKTAQNALKSLMGEPKKVTPLSVKRQVDLFLSMDDSTLQAIRAQRGDVEYNRYVSTMTIKAKELYNG